MQISDWRRWLAGSGLALAALLIGVALGLGLVSARPVAAVYECNAADLSGDWEAQSFLSMLNGYRAQYGETPLTISGDLNRAASWMAGDMANNAYFSHTDSLGRPFWSRVSDCGGYAPGGENIAGGFDTAEAAFETWRNSADHNANMLNAGFRQIGIGRYFNPNSLYGWYWATDFCY
jgi:uncharacterized protein YkwD